MLSSLTFNDGGMGPGLMSRSFRRKRRNMDGRPIAIRRGDRVPSINVVSNASFRQVKASKEKLRRLRMLPAAPIKAARHHRRRARILRFLDKKRLPVQSVWCAGRHAKSVVRSYESPVRYAASRCPVGMDETQFTAASHAHVGRPTCSQDVVIAWQSIREDGGHPGGFAR
jgi:hypothetical protein